MPVIQEEKFETEMSEHIKDSKIPAKTKDKESKKGKRAKKSPK